MLIESVCLAWFWVFAWLFSCLDVATVWGLVACLCGCVPSVSVGWLSVRPFGCRGGCGGLVLGGLVAVVCFSVVAVACRCRFGAFFWGFLPFSVVGWCVCLSVAFRGNLGHLSALFGGCPCFCLVGGYPVPIFWRVSGGRITPLKFPKKIFYWVGVGERAGEFP